MNVVWLVLSVLAIIGMIDIVRMVWWWLQSSTFDDDILSAIAQGNTSLAMACIRSQVRWETAHPPPSPHLLGWPFVMLAMLVVLLLLVVTFLIEQRIRWFIRGAQKAHIGPYRQVR